MENTRIFLRTCKLIYSRQAVPLILASACFLSGLQPAFAVIWPLCNLILPVSLFALSEVYVKITFLETCLYPQKVTGSGQCDTSTSLHGLQTDVMFLLRRGNFKLWELCAARLALWAFGAARPDRKVNVSVTPEGLKTILPLVYLAHLHLVYYTTVHWYLPGPGLRPAGQ